MLDLVKTELESHNAFDGSLPPIVGRMIETVPNQTIPERMKILFSIAELTTFASQFRRNIWHWDGFELPINAVSFGIMGSGQGKDSSIKAIRRSFATAYALITAERVKQAKELAVTRADESGESDPSDEKTWIKYYEEPASMSTAPATPEGLIKHINEMSDLPLGATILEASELGDEFANNMQMPDIIKTLAEVYDTGDKAVVFTKNKEFRSKEIKAMPLSALFVGSPAFLLHDENIKRKFILAFTSKLARRSNFCYVPKILPRPEYASVKEAIADERHQIAMARTAAEKISEGTSAIAKYHLKKQNELLQLDEEVFELYYVYERYNYETSNLIASKYPLSKLVRLHLQWKALKLAGALAIFDGSDVVTKNNFLDAIRLCEFLDKDMMLFEADLIKEPYESFADYMKLQAVQGKSDITLHDLRKMGYIPKTGNAEAKMKELVKLAASYDPEAIYAVTDDGIDYEGIIPTDDINLSFKPVNNSKLISLIAQGADKAHISDEKQSIARTAVYGYESGPAEFADLGPMLQRDLAYSPFEFIDGTRSKANLIPRTKWIVFDIDDSSISDEEVHFLLSDINHHVARTSDPSNAYKFRLLIELDATVELNAIEWKAFYSSVASELALNVDQLPQSQIFYAYSSTPEVLSVTDCSPFRIRDHIMTAKEQAIKAPSPTKLSTPQKKAQLQDPLETFAYCFNAPSGTGSRAMIRMIYHAKDLEATKIEIVELLNDVQLFWDYPMEDHRFNHTILGSIDRILAE